MKKVYFKSIDSTNTYLKSNYKNLDHMTWVSTDHQSMGKGRLHKHWFGNHHSLMCSVLLKGDINIDHIELLPLLAAKSLHTVLSTYHSNIKIKWPNDLLINDLKLSGILVESVLESNQVLAIMIGFGVNINHQSFDDDIKDIATSLYLTTQKRQDKEKIYNDLINQFQKDFSLFKSSTQFVIDYCNQHLAFKGENISFMDQNQVLKANMIKIEDNGHLLVETKTRKMSLYSGEISLIK